MEAVHITTMERGLEGITAYTATFSEETCGMITCHTNGGKAAWFNPFLKTCYCRTLPSPQISSTDRMRRALPDFNADPTPRGVHASPARPAFEIAKPSAETCSQMITCHGESKPYFHSGLTKCLCVVYRSGIKEPVITSDNTIFPRTEQVASRVERNALASENVFGSDSDKYAYCWGDFARENCKGVKRIGRWSESLQKCVCLPVGAIFTDRPNPWKKSSKTLADSLSTPNLDKRAKWYLKCTDNLHECLSDPLHYRCDSNRKMIKRQQSDICDKKCECGGLNLAACMDPRGGCSYTRPDHPGLENENRKA